MPFVENLFLPGTVGTTYAQCLSCPVATPSGVSRFSPFHENLGNIPQPGSGEPARDPRPTPCHRGHALLSSQMLARLLKSSHPEDLRAANKLIKEMVQEVMAEPEHREEGCEDVQLGCEVGVHVHRRDSVVTQLKGCHSSEGAD